MVRRTRVRQLMSRPVFTLPAGTGIRQAAGELHARGIGGAPVIDGRGNAIGVLSLRDLAGCLTARLLDLPALFPTLDGPEFAETAASCPLFEDLDRATVSEVMSPHVFCVDPGSSILEAVRLMRKHAIRRIFVRKGGEPLEGVLTPTDVLRWIDERGRRRVRKSGKPVLRRRRESKLTSS